MADMGQSKYMQAQSRLTETFQQTEQDTNLAVYAMRRTMDWGPVEAQAVF